MKPLLSIALLLLTTNVFGHQGVSDSFYDYEPENESLFPQIIICDIEESVSISIDHGMSYQSLKDAYSRSSDLPKHRFEYKGQGVYRQLWSDGSHMMPIFRAKVSRHDPVMLVYQEPQYEGNRGVDWVFQIDKLTSSIGVRQDYRDGRFTEQYAMMWNTGTCKYSQRDRD